VHELFSGWRSLKLKKNLVIVESMMEKLETAIAGFMENPKKYITMGIAIPPPPMPATLLKSMNIANKIVPIHSIP
jgi:hypothetical protein